MQCALAEIARWWRSHRSKQPPAGRNVGPNGTTAKDSPALGMRSHLQHLCSTNVALRTFIAERLHRLSGLVCTLCDDFTRVGDADNSPPIFPADAFSLPSSFSRASAADNNTEAGDVAALAAHAASFADKLGMHDHSLRGYKHAVSIVESERIINRSLSAQRRKQKANSSVHSTAVATIAGTAALDYRDDDHSHNGNQHHASR